MVPGMRWTAGTARAQHTITWWEINMRQHGQRSVIYSNGERENKSIMTDPYTLHDGYHMKNPILRINFTERHSTTTALEVPARIIRCMHIRLEGCRQGGTVQETVVGLARQQALWLRDKWPRIG
jgi:hypothetical protein